MLTIKNGIVQGMSINGVPFRAMIIKAITKKHRPMIPMKPRYTVYHDTGNTSKGSTALAHQSLLQNYEGNPIPSQVGWHFVVDDKEIIQCIPINEIAYCQGDGGGIGNSSGISVEQCINSDGDTAKAEENACKLHGALIKTLGVTLKKHQDFSGKNCPQVILNAKRWPEIVDKVNKYASLPTLSSQAGGSTTPIPPVKANPEQFIETIANDVKRYAQNLLPSVTIAQAILESASGTSELAIRANALFGIKAKDDWKGQTFSKTTQEHVGGKTITITVPFRSYPSREASIKDHDAFFVTPEWRIAHYERVRQATTAEDQAQALKDCGYATDPDYADKLIAVINKYDLKQYDPVMVSKEPLADQEIWVYAKASADMDDALRIVNSVSGARLVDMSITPKKAGVLVVQIGGVKDDASDLLLSGSDRYETAAIVDAWIKSRRRIL